MACKGFGDEVVEMGTVQSMTVDDLPDGETRVCEVPWPRKGLNYVSKKLKGNKTSWSPLGARESGRK